MQTDPKDVHAYEAGAKRVGANLLFGAAKLLDVQPNYFFQGYPAGEVSNLNSEPMNQNRATRVDQSFIVRRAFDSIASAAFRQATATIVIEMANARSAL